MARRISRLLLFERIRVRGRFCRERRSGYVYGFFD